MFGVLIGVATVCYAAKNSEMGSKTSLQCLAILAVGYHLRQFAPLLLPALAISAVSQPKAEPYRDYRRPAPRRGLRFPYRPFA